jgi:hypothetical protein
MLTTDEIILAGGNGNFSSDPSYTYYLYIGDYYWSLSPNSFQGYAREFLLGNGGLSVSEVNGSYGFRPVVSLKPGIEFETDGDGTPTNPYIVKYD